MNANVTINDLCMHPSLKDFFFRDQSWNTFQELLSRAVDDENDVIDKIDSQTEDLDLDDIEEDFYEMSVEELAKEYNIELQDEDDDEDDDEN